MLVVQEVNPEILFSDSVVKEESKEDCANYVIKDPKPSTSTYRPELEEQQGFIHATDIFAETPRNKMVKDEVKEEEIDDYNYQGTSKTESNANSGEINALDLMFPSTSEVKEELETEIKPNVPQQQESSPPTQQKTKWRAEAAPGWKNPVFIYKFLVINSQTKQKQLKCYTFSLHKMGLNIHVCNYCKSLGTTTVIAITDGFFVRDPLKLNHVCFPKLYEEEIRLRTNYSSPQTQAEGLAFLDGGSSSKQAQSRLRHRKPMVLFDATVVASRVGKNPTMYYRSYGDTNLCWSFMYQWERKNGTAIFVCAGCNKHDERVPIPVLGNKFCADPSKLKHVCQPLYWPDEEEKLILREMKRKQPTKKSRKEAKLAELAEEEMCLDQLIKGECNGEVDEPLAKQMKLEEPEQY